MPLFQRDGVWYIDLRRPKRGRIRRSTGTRDKSIAQRQHDELAARLWKEKQTGKQFTDALTLWLEAAPRSRQELSALAQIRKRYKDRPLRDVSGTNFAEAFIGLKPATYNRTATIVRAALNLTVGVGWLESVPKIARRKEPKRGFRWLTADEWAKLYAVLPSHLQPMAAFALATGLRWSNVAELTWERIDLRRRMAWIEAPDAKGGKAIPVALNTGARTALRALGGARKGFVFTYLGVPIKSPKTAWKTAWHAAKIPAVRWHDLRHTFASWHIINGTPPEVLQKLGGWSSLDQVMIYAHLAPSHVARYADNAVPPGRNGPNFGPNRNAKAA